AIPGGRTAHRVRYAVIVRGDGVSGAGERTLDSRRGEDRGDPVCGVVDRQRTADGGPADLDAPRGAGEAHRPSDLAVLDRDDLGAGCGDRAAHEGSGQLQTGTLGDGHGTFHGGAFDAGRPRSHGKGAAVVLGDGVIAGDCRLDGVAEEVRP